MKPTRSIFGSVAQPITTLALMVVVSCGFILTGVAADSPPPAAKAEPAAKKLTGAELYAINCNRCHQERYPTEFNSAQWQTLITHMRVRANLPAKQAKEILKYMKEEAGK